MSISKVHGDIRRLEIDNPDNSGTVCVHGDIRRLEKYQTGLKLMLQVHGDIRRLEIMLI